MEGESKLKKFGGYLLAAIGILVVALLAKYLMKGGDGEPTPLPYQSSYQGGGAAVGGYGGAYKAAIAPGAPASVESMDYAAPSENVNMPARQSAGTAQTPDRKVVKTGSLKLLVNKAEPAAEQIKAVALNLGGLLDEVDIYSISEAEKTGRVTIKVPAAKFDEAVSKIKTIAVKVERENVGATDITEAFMDLEARLKNLKAEEAQYLEIMKRATTVADTLKVASSLSGVRGEIERMEGQIKFLSGQVAMSSITVNLIEESDVKVFGLHWRPLFEIKQAVRSMLDGLVGYVNVLIAFVFILPALALWIVTAVAALWVIRKIYRWVKNKFFVS